MTTDTKTEPRRKDDVHPTRELTWTDMAPAGAQLVDVMIDTETLGTTPGSAILNIGAVMFGPAGLGEEFYAPISLASCTEAGLTIDPGTVAWWMKQSDAARAAAFRDDAEPLPAVLEQFTSWFNLVEAERPWAQGANFDPPLLEAAYRACGMTPPWKYHNVRDTRTLYDLAGVRVDRARGTHHNALDDARAQAEAAVVALQRLPDARSPVVAVAPADATGKASAADEIDLLPERRKCRHCDATTNADNPAEICDTCADAAPAADAVVQALKGAIPLVEPVYIGKALRAGREARACLSGGTGPLACVMLVNIQLTPWTQTKEKAEAYADGYNRALGDLRSAVLEVIAQDQYPATSAADAKDAARKPLAHGHRDDYHLMANARRIAQHPIKMIRTMPNWALAHELFATGSNSARQICYDAGIDPDGYQVQRAAMAAAPSSEKGGAIDADYCPACDLPDDAFQNCGSPNCAMRDYGPGDACKRRAAPSSAAGKKAK